MNKRIMALLSICFLLPKTALWFVGCSAKDTQASNTQTLSNIQTGSAVSIVTAMGNSEPEDKIELEEQGMVLTEQIVTMALDTITDKEITQLEDIEITRFILTLSFYRENPHHPYHSAINVTPERLYIFPLSNVQKLAKDLFGRDNWDFGSTIEGIDVHYNEDKQQYESGLEFGLGNGRYDCQKMKAAYLPENNTVEVDFTLLSYLNSESDPSWEEETERKMTFAVVEEEGKSFLRFVSLV